MPNGHVSVAVYPFVQDGVVIGWRVFVDDGSMDDDGGLLPLFHSRGGASAAAHALRAAYRLDGYRVT